MVLLRAETWLKREALVIIVGAPKLNPQPWIVCKSLKIAARFRALTPSPQSRVKFGAIWIT
jgi:hypothetical protein